MKKSLYLLLLLVLSSCMFNKSKEKSEGEDNEFYTAEKTEDMWRIPLLEPYELVSPTNTDPWFLMAEKPKISGPDYQNFFDDFQFTNIYRVGVKNKIIRLDNTDENWTKRGESFPTTLLINTTTNEFFICPTEAESKLLNAKLSEWNASDIKLLDFEELRNAYQEKGKALFVEEK